MITITGYHIITVKAVADYDLVCRQAKKKEEVIKNEEKQKKSVNAGANATER